MHPTGPCPRMRNHARSRYPRTRANSCSVWKPNRSAPQAQTFDQRFVALRVRRLDIVEQLSTRLDHLDEAAARMVVLAMRLEVFGQVVDALRKDSAGMPSSAVEIGLRCSKAAGICIKPLRVSSAIASPSQNEPMRVRRSRETCPTVPRNSARSRTQALT